MWSTELRPGEEVIVDLGITGAWLVESCTDGGVRAEGARERRISLQPVAYAPDGKLVVGEPARRRLAEAPLAGVSEWLDRVGDDVPIVLDGRTVMPEDLFAQVLRSQLDDGVDALRLVVPASWGPYRQGLAQDALRRAGVGSVRIVSAPLATLQAPGLEVPDTGRVLVIDAGDRRTSASLVELEGPDGPRLARVAAADLGGSDIDEALVEFVRPRLVGPVTDGDALLRACRTARESLSFAPAVELHPAGAEPLRLVRAELDALVGDRLRSTVAALLDRIGRGAADAVVLAGGLARMPLLVETVSALVDRPVQVPADPGLAAVRGAARGVPPVEARTELPATALMAPVPASEDESTELEGGLEPPAEARREPRARHGLLVPLRRYGGFASAAATVVVVLSAPLAFPGLNLGLADLSQQQATGTVMAESRSAGDRATTGASGPDASDTRPGPLRIVADLLTPGTAAAQEGTPRQASARETPGPLRALADRLASATPSGRPSPSGAKVERSTSPTSTDSSTGRSASVPSEPTSGPDGQTEVAEESASEPTQTAPAPVRTPVPAPAPATTQPAPEPTTAPPTSQAPAPQPEPTTAPPAPAPAPSDPAPAADPAPAPAPAPDPAPEPDPAPAPTTSTTSSAPDPAPSETLDAGAV